MSRKPDFSFFTKKTIRTASNRPHFQKRCPWIPLHNVIFSTTKFYQNEAFPLSLCRFKWTPRLKVLICFHTRQNIVCILVKLLQTSAFTALKRQIIWNTRQIQHCCATTLKCQGWIFHKSNYKWKRQSKRKGSLYTRPHYSFTVRSPYHSITRKNQGWFLASRNIMRHKCKTIFKPEETVFT